MLNCAEDLLLLALDDDTGAFHRVTNIDFNLALIGSLLMDLAIRNRIAVELDNLHVISTEKTGDAILDEILAILGTLKASTNTSSLVRQLYNSLEHLKDRLLKNLEAKGIVRCAENKVLWLFKKRRYPMIDDREETEVQTRIRNIVTQGATPEAKDLALFSLLHICDLMGIIFSKEELAKYHERIEELQDRDEIGHSVNKIIDEVHAMLATVFIA